MKFPGRLYKGEKGTYLALYNHYTDIWMACPDSLEGKADKIGHVRYGWGGYTRGIDVFKLRSELEIPEINLQPTIGLPKGNLTGVDQRQEVHYEILSNSPSEVWDIVRGDIREFVISKDKNRPANKKIGTNMKRVSVLTPITEIKLINPWKGRILTPGKHEFVRQCGNYANIDFTKGCVTSLVSSEGHLLDLTHNEARGVYVAPWRECDYCYAQNKHKPALKTVYKFDWNWLKEELLGAACLKTGSDEPFGRKVERLRFGKRTEAASSLTLPQFTKTLEICAETGTRGVIPTKFLEHDPEVAKLLKRTDSVVLYSIGWDEFEKGAVSWGCSNDWRLEQAVKYGEAGVKTAVYLMIADPVKDPNGRDHKIINFTERHKENLVGVQLLPMRFKAKVLSSGMGSIHWDDAKSDKGLLALVDSHVGAFEVVGGELNPKEFNPFWLELIGDNKGFYRMCHHTNEHVWCGGCFTKDGLSIDEKRVPVQAVKRTARPEDRRRKKKKEEVKDDHPTLFEWKNK